MTSTNGTDKQPVPSPWRVLHARPEGNGWGMGWRLHKVWLLGFSYFFILFHTFSRARITQKLPSLYRFWTCYEPCWYMTRSTLWLTPRETVSFVFLRPSMLPQAKPRGTLRVEGKQKSLFPLGPVRKCFVIPSNSKWEKLRKNVLLDTGWKHKFAAVSRCTTWSLRKFNLLFPQGIREFWSMTRDTFCSN